MQPSAGSTSEAGLASEPQNSSYFSAAPELGLHVCATVHSPHLVLEINSNPYPCVTSSVLTEPSHSPRIIHS